MKSSAVLLLLASAGCQTPFHGAPSASQAAADTKGNPVQAKPTRPADPAEAAPAVTTLQGAWRVAGIDDKDFNEPYGLALSADADKLWWDPRCAGIERSYRITGNEIRFGPVRASSADGSQAGPVCRIAAPPRLSEVVRALDAATTITRTPANGIRIAGGGHSLTLFSQ